MDNLTAKLLVELAQAEWYQCYDSSQVATLYCLSALKCNDSFPFERDNDND